MLRKQTDDIVIRSKISTSARLVIVVVGIVIICGAVVSAYRFGYTKANSGLQTAEEEIQRLQGELREANDRNVELRTSIAQVERQLQIDKVVYAELTDDLKSSNAQMADLKKELKFYRSIIAPTDGRSGVQIQDFIVKPTDRADSYTFKLVLIQALRHSEEVIGNVDLQVKGSNDGRPMLLHYPQSPEQPIYVKFRYFQTIQGVLDLPQGFAPAEIKVSVTVDGKKKKTRTTERWYPWPRA